MVKARWNVKDSGGWHNAGEVFETEQDLGDAVEILDEPKAAVPVKESEPAVAEEPARPKSTSRRKVSK